LHVGGATNERFIRVLVGNRNRTDRLLLLATLRRDPGLRVAGCANAHEFQEIAAREKPDLAILSANLDESSPVAMATLRQFHDAHPKVPTVVLLDSPKRDLVLDAFRAGARGIFSRHESLDTLCKCVRVVFEGQVWATSREIRIALDALSSVPTIRALNAGGLSLLSKRELEVVHHLAEGLTNREIGARLGLSRHTIKNYLLKIFDKLGVSNRVELLFLTLSQPHTAMHTPRRSTEDSNDA
jgi:DNA-binding NarL/FixJ family response regulator